MAGRDQKTSEKRSSYKLGWKMEEIQHKVDTEAKSKGEDRNVKVKQEKDEVTLSSQ